MKTIVEMTPITSCSASTCAYNVQSQCHAKAITVGNSTNPSCDTYLDSGRHTQNRSIQAGVGACKTTDCVANEDFECAAESVTIGKANGAITCLTYKKRTES